MADELSEVPARQQGQGGRDALVAGRDIHYHVGGAGDSGGGGGGPAAGREPFRKLWGGVPARNPGFKGREELLQAVRDALVGGDHAVVQALHGMGGVGKTQIAIEYTHRFAADYHLVWWVNSERRELIAEQFAALAGELGCAMEGAPLAVMQRAVLAALHERDRWLVIFDNVERPDHVAPWLPGGAGHVIITSRAYGWDDLAVPVSVNVFSRAESETILQSRVMGLTGADAELVAAAVGDLPLAVAQAAGYMAYTGIPAGEYVSLLRDRPVEILELGKPYSYPQSLAAATRLSWEQMQAQDPVTAQVASICAFLAPEPFPAEWLPSAADKLPGTLGQQARDPVAWRQVIARLRGSGLVRVDPDGLVMHRLTQAIIRDLHGSTAPALDLAQATVLANVPDSTLSTTWRAWARVLPHLTALDPAASASEQLRSAAATAVLYLVDRGDVTGARAMASELFEAWRERLGEDDRVTLRVGNWLARSLAMMGQYADAQFLNEYILDRRRAVYGKDDPETLTTVSNLTQELRKLGAYLAARELDEDTLARSRRVLGDDHPETLRSASNLAEDLRWLGDFLAARQMEEATLARFRRRLGADHPETLRSASNLAAIFRGLKDFHSARQLDEDTLARRRRVLGMHHPFSFNSANYLAMDLRRLGEIQAARRLDEDTLDGRRRVLGEDHPDTRKSAENLAEDLRLLGES